MNVVAVDAAYEYAEKNFNVNNFKHKLEKQSTGEPRIFLTGNQAVAMGKVLGGCRVQTYYPITPAADESEYLESHEILKTRIFRNKKWCAMVQRRRTQRIGKH